METKLGFDRKFTVLIYEAIGTALYTYCILVSTADSVASVLGLFSVIIIFGDVTGGHFNPAVTLGVMIWQFFKGGTIKKMFFASLIILAQCLGTLIGALLSFTALNVKGVVPKDYVPVLAP